MDNKEIIENIKQAITNARVDLEQGGKYDWNNELESCDNWLKTAIRMLDNLK